MLCSDGCAVMYGGGLADMVLNSLFRRFVAADEAILVVAVMKRESGGEVRVYGYTVQ